MIEFPFIIYSNKDKKIIYSEQMFIKPIWTEITPFCIELTGITKEKLEKEGIKLEESLERFDKVVKSLEGNFIILTDGEWDIKQLLYREASKKKIPLKEYFSQFLDLRKLYKKKFPGSKISGLKSMIKNSKIDVSGLNHHSGIDDAKMILKVFTYLLSYEEFKIEKEDVIIIPKDYDSHSDRTLGDYNRVFKLTNVAWIRGLPFTVRKSEVEEVLQGLEYTSFHLVAVKDNPKQCNGSMYVVFKDIEETRKSLVQVQGKYIGKRYLEVKYSSEEDMNQHLKEVGEMIQ